MSILDIDFISYSLNDNSAYDNPLNILETVNVVALKYLQIK